MPVVHARAGLMHIVHKQPLDHVHSARAVVFCCFECSSPSAGLSSAQCVCTGYKNGRRRSLLQHFGNATGEVSFDGEREGPTPSFAINAT